MTKIMQSEYRSEALAQVAVDRLNIPGYIPTVVPVYRHSSNGLEVPVTDITYRISMMPDHRSGERLGDKVNDFLHKGPARHVVHALSPIRDSSGCKGCFKRHGQLNKLDRVVRTRLGIEKRK